MYFFQSLAQRFKNRPKVAFLGTFWKILTKKLSFSCSFLFLRNKVIKTTLADTFSCFQTSMLVEFYDNRAVTLPSIVLRLDFNLIKIVLRGIRNSINEKQVYHENPNFVVKALKIFKKGQDFKKLLRAKQILSFLF